MVEEKKLSSFNPARASLGMEASRKVRLLLPVSEQLTYSMAVSEQYFLRDIVSKVLSLESTSHLTRITSSA